MDQNTVHEYNQDNVNIQNDNIQNDNIQNDNEVVQPEQTPTQRRSKRTAKPSEKLLNEENTRLRKALGLVNVGIQLRSGTVIVPNS